MNDVVLPGCPLDSPVKTGLPSLPADGAAEAAYAPAYQAFIAKDYEGAIAEFERLLAADPNDATASFNAGQALFELGHYALSAEKYEHVTRLMPENARAWFKFSVGCLYSGRFSEMESAAKRAVDMEPWQAEYHNCYGQILTTLGRHDEALPYFNASQTFMPEWAAPKVNLAYALLHLGRWSEAWPLFEYRRLCGAVPEPYPGVQQWDGERLEGKTLIVRCEQGLGDSLMCARFIPYIRQLYGGEVILVPDKPVQRLFKWTVRGCRHAELGDTFPSVDYQTILMSLPRLAGTVPGAVPPPIRYHGVSEDLAFWGGMIPQRAVGICYTAGLRLGYSASHEAVGKHKSIPFEAVQDLWRVPGVRAISLQKESIDELLGRPADFADTAALIEHLDLVITVDTSVAHLAGSMGKDVWVLLPFDCCWRWRGDGREWYPQARVFRQHSLGDWSLVARDVEVALREWGAGQIPERY